MSGKAKWYEKEYVLALCFASVVFAPLGLLIFWGLEKFGKKAKVVLTVTSAVFFFGALFFVARAVNERVAPSSAVVSSDVPAVKSSVVTDAKKLEGRAKPKKAAEKDVVYVTTGGKKYHLSNYCGKGKYLPLNLSEALKKGYKACKKCTAKK